MDRRSFVAALGLSGSIAAPALAASCQAAPSDELTAAFEHHRKARALVELATQTADDLTRSGRINGGLGEGKVLFAYVKRATTTPTGPLFTPEMRLEMDEAFAQEDAALLAVLAFPCRSETDAVAKARYVLDECQGMELDARHVMALCRSHLAAVV
jgi:hypothetical protein